MAAFLVTAVAVNLLHTASHAGQRIMFLPAWQLAYVTVAIYAAPVVAAVLLWTRYDRAGAWLLVAAMAGSLVFGLLYHFVVPGPDNVFTQPPGPWRTTFGVTAVLLALLQVIGGSVGVWAARRIPRSSTTGSENHPARGLAGSRWEPGSEPR